MIYLYIICFISLSTVMTGSNDFVLAKLDLSILKKQPEKLIAQHPQGSLWLQTNPVKTLKEDPDFIVTQNNSLQFLSKKYQITIECNFNIAQAAINEDYLVIIGNDLERYTPLTDQIFQRKSKMNTQRILLYSHRNYSHFDLENYTNLPRTDFTIGEILDLKPNMIVLRLQEKKSNEEDGILKDYSLYLNPKVIDLDGLGLDDTLTVTSNNSSLGANPESFNINDQNPVTQQDDKKPAQQKKEKSSLKALFLNLTNKALQHWKPIVSSVIIVALLYAVRTFLRG